MVKKDKVLEEKLTRYAESVKPQKGIIDGAIYALRLRRQALDSGRYIPAPADPVSAGVPRSRSGKRWIFSSVAAVVVAAVFIGIIAGIINRGGGATNNKPDVSAPSPAVITPYSLSALTVSEGGVADAQSAGLLTLGGTGETLSAQGKVYKNKEGETAVISVFYKMVGGGGVDEILVVADIGRGLTDYREFKRHPSRTIAGVRVYEYEEMLNGEYYTNLYFAHGDVDYYLIIASPVKDSAEVYVTSLIT